MKLTSALQCYHYGYLTVIDAEPGLSYHNKFNIYYSIIIMHKCDLLSSKVRYYNVS